MQEKKLNKAVSDVKLMKTPEGKTEVKNAVKDATKAKKEKQPAKTEIIVQYQQNAANLGELEDKVKKQFVAEGHRAGCIKTLNIYVKPEEYKAYYVINDKFFGSVDLF